MLEDYNTGAVLNQTHYRNLALWVVILVMVLLLVTMLRQGQQPVRKDLAYSAFLEKLASEQIISVTIEENQITGELSDGTDFATYAPRRRSDVASLIGR